jgi:pimeloyl-ACP methyl ester carboxylesterase
VELAELELDGKPVRYRVAGVGPPVVLVHGLSGSWRWWTSVYERLAERRRVYMLDLPRLGLRLSAAELGAWLGRWLRAGGLDSVDLVGHSLGGLVAAELAASEPERVLRLALVAPAGIPCGRRLSTRALRLVETLYDIRGRLPTMAGDALRAGPLGLIDGAFFASVRDLRAELASVRAHSLLVWGELDRLVPMTVVPDWQQALPGARLVVLQCGHVPMWEAPNELAACLATFLDEELPDDTSTEKPGITAPVPPRSR